jgi:serine/threonine protein kinase
MDQMLGHCRVVAKIGEGGMGVFYRAYDEVSHCDVAVKVANKDARLVPGGARLFFFFSRPHTPGPRFPGRDIPRRWIMDWRVVRFKPSLTAAREILPLVSCRT